MIFAYDANYLIDNKLGIIVDAEGTRPNRIAENHVAETMIERVAERFALRPKRLGADTAYGTGRTLKRLVDRGIEPHIPVRDKSARPDGTFSRTDFQYGQARDLFICPGGKELKTSGSVPRRHHVQVSGQTERLWRVPPKPKRTTGPRTPIRERPCPGQY